MPEVTDLMRVAQWAKSSSSPSDVYNAACRLLDEHGSRRAEALQSWTTGLNEWGRRSLELLNATERDAESNGGGRTPQTQGAVEGQGAREAQGAAQCRICHGTLPPGYVCGHCRTIYPKVGQPYPMREPDTTP